MVLVIQTLGYMNKIISLMATRDSAFLGANKVTCVCFCRSADMHDNYVYC